MKYIFIIMILLLIPNVIATEEQIITTDITLHFDKTANNEAIITISGENLQWSKTINFDHTIDTTDNSTNESIGFPNSFVEELQIILLRELGNITDVRYEIFRCNEMANFSHLWELCIRQRTDFELMIANDMIYKTNFSEMEGNLTTKFTNLESEYETYKASKDAAMLVKDTRIEDLERHRQFGWGIGIISLGVAIYLLNKYQGFGKRKQQIETEFPKDVAV